MPVTWIVIADSRYARLFELRNSAKDLHEIKHFSNPALDSEQAEPAFDQDGRYADAGDAATQIAEPQVLPVGQRNDLFAKEITGYLNQSRTECRYDNLFLIAAPSFLGLIRGNLNHDVQRMLEEELPSNLALYDLRQIEQYLDGKFE